MINKELANLTEEEERILNEESLLYFSLSSLPHYFTLPPAEFHQELVDLLENPESDMLEIIGFRGSAKTTFGSLALPLWSAITERFKFIILINDTSDQMELNLANIKYELENNRYINRLYPHIKSEDSWSKNKLVLSNGVRILGRSRGQKIRGIRHRQHRPDLVIIDDPEDLKWVQKKKNRDKTDRWFNGEVIPAVQEDNSKLVIIGNLLHKDALMSRIKRNNLFDVIELPLIKPEGDEGLSEWERCTWKAKYPNQEALDRQKEKVGRVSWHREYLLNIISEEDQVVTSDELVYYSNERLTTSSKKHRINAYDGAIAIDLAISDKDTADYTAMVLGVKAREDGEEIIYILPHTVNKRLDLNQTIRVAENHFNLLPLGAKAVVEDVAYQKAAIKEMNRRTTMPTDGIKPIGNKRARFETAAIYIKQGRVRFPKKGCEELIDQMLGFGVEEHDDLLDAMVYLILYLVEGKKATAGVGRGDAV